MDFSDVCVVVPVYNEGPVVAATVASLLRTFGDVVCVDDGSVDDSGTLAAAAGATVLRHVVNQGQGASLQTGFDYVMRHTDAAYVVTFDADGQHRVEDAMAMVEHCRTSGVDVVLASRFIGATTDMPRSRRALLRLATWFTRRTSGLEVTDTHNGLRVLSRQALRQVRLQLPRMAHASELLNAIRPHGLSYAELPATVVYSDYSRAKGQRNIDSLNIVFDLALARMRAAR